MEKEIHENKKLVVYWLTKDDSNDQTLQHQIHEESKVYREKKYKIVLFHSGNEPFYDNTLALLKHNHRNYHKHSTIQAKI